MYYSFGSLQRIKNMERTLIHKEQLKQFGYALREWRQEVGVTMQALSVKSGISLNSIARIERGEIDPKCGTAYKLWQALGDLCLPY